MTLDELKTALSLGMLSQREVLIALYGHKVTPLDALEGYWRCSCGQIFRSVHGWALCPDTGRRLPRYSLVIAPWTGAGE